VYRQGSACSALPEAEVGDGDEQEADPQVAERVGHVAAGSTRAAGSLRTSARTDQSMTYYGNRSMTYYGTV
jgi:hypothetical protein